MRRGQASIEVIGATVLLVVVIAAAWLVSSGAWLQAEVTVAEVAGTQAGFRGQDARSAALAAVPPWARSRVSDELNATTRGSQRAPK